MARQLPRRAEYESGRLATVPPAIGSTGHRFRVAWLLGAVGLAALLGGTCIAQRQRSRRFDLADPQNRNGVPTWQVDERFPTDVFTFVRVEYSSWRGRGRWGGGWATDWPDSDLNLPFRLQELTSLKVHPNPKTLRLTADELFDYPFLYLIEPGGLEFDDEEVTALRRYLLRGGFLMVDDFWGGHEWANFYREIRRVFPDREPQELAIDHEIFRCVYRLKEKPQVPSIHHFMNGDTYEYRPSPDDDGSTPHYRAIFDDKGRMMAIICHNTDLGDGWEREGVDEEYFHQMSERKAYPMGINILFYAMTH
jgi:hypothetical protein